MLALGTDAWLRLILSGRQLIFGLPTSGQAQSLHTYIGRHDSLPIYLVKQYAYIPIYHIELMWELV